MKAELYRNIDLVRINIKQGIREYFFPQNVDWSGKQVHKIVVCAPDGTSLDPLDGTTPVLGTSTTLTTDNLFFNLYNSDQKQIVRDLAAVHIVNTNNNPLELNSVLDLSLCNLYFTEDPDKDYTLLLYIYWATEIAEDYDMPQWSVTTQFPLAAGQEINLQEIINTYVHALPSTIKGILFWNAESNPAYITLRDHTLTYILQNIHSELAKPTINASRDYADNVQKRIMLFNDIDIDMEYSHIRNASASDNTQKITFLY